MTDEPTILTDPSTGRPILAAPGRQARPVLTIEGHDHGPCPFCPGQEHQTPPERDAVRTDGSAPGTPGWRARAFGNRYPAAEWHEIIAEGPAHETQPAALDLPLWTDVVTLYRRRIGHIESQPGVRCGFLFKNVGREAGASIAHNHSQLLGLPTLPPRLALELDHLRRDGCGICAQLATAEREDRVIARTANYTFLSPREAKLPYECWLVPHDHAADFLDDDDGALAEALHRMHGIVAAALDSPPYNTWVHRVPGEDFHWHLELQPRIGFLAALELGGDMYMNAVPPQVTAARMRVGDSG